jgi:glycosyltransferase involved in cell wall biosynthesis
MPPILDRFRGRRRATQRPSTRGNAERVAFVGPVPPGPTGIATYDRAVLDGLRRIGFAPPIDVVWPVGPVHLSSIRSYRIGVYQLGNNVDHHLDIYRLAWQHPGLVVLHDLALDDFVRGLQSAADMLGYVAVREALEAEMRLPAADPTPAGPLRIPWAAAIARHSRGIVVHAEFCRRYLEAFGCRTPIFVVPHPPVEEPEAIHASLARGRTLHAREVARGASTLVVAAGDLNEAKRLDVVMDAVGRLDHGVRLALVGRRVETFDVGPAVRAAGLGDRVAVHADVADEDFLGWLAAADVVVDLRHPHRGEVSGTLARAMQVGRPTIVSATGTYLDVPEGTVRYVTGGSPDPAELAARIRELADDQELRDRVGAAARAHMDRLRASDATAHAYAEAIEATADVVHDPIRAPMSRWAGALVELGWTQEQLALGWGRRYARALESFKRSP